MWDSLRLLVKRPKILRSRLREEAQILLSTMKRTWGRAEARKHSKKVSPLRPRRQELRAPIENVTMTTILYRSWRIWLIGSQVRHQLATLSVHRSESISNLAAASLYLNTWTVHLSSIRASRPSRAQSCLICRKFIAAIGASKSSRRRADSVAMRRQYLARSKSKSLITNSRNIISEGNSQRKSSS